MLAEAASPIDNKKIAINKGGILTEVDAIVSKPNI